MYINGIYEVSTIIIPSYRGGEGGTEIFSNFPMATQLLSTGGKIYT